MKPRVVFVESNTTGTGALMLEAATRLGFEPVLIATDPRRYRLGGDETTVVLDTANRESIVSWCRTSPGGPVRAVTSSSEYFIETAAAVAEELGLRSPGTQAIRECRDKHAQRLRLAEAGVGCPRFIKITSVDEVSQSLVALAFPVVVKPCFGSGSVGVRRCRDLTEVRKHVETLLSIPANERGLAQPKAMLIEEFIDGDEYSVEVFSLQVVGITRKRLGALPHFVETGHDFPAPLPERDAALLRDAATASVRALGLRGGPAHVEAKLLRGAVTLIEVNPRLAGGFIPELVRRACGVELLEQVVRWAAGEDPDLAPKFQRHASIRFCIPGTTGTVSAITGVSDAREVPLVEDVRLYKAVGEAVALNGDFRDRVGHVIAVGVTNERTSSAADVGHALLDVQVNEQRVA